MFSELLAKIARSFAGRGIDYVVIGGQAVLIHGEPRLTRDVDVTLGAGLDRLDEVLAAARSAQLEPLVDPEEFTRETMVLPCRDHPSGLRVDLVLSDSPYEREALAHAVIVEVGGYPVRFLSAEDLVIHKLIAGRPRDLEDVRGVLARRPDLDLARARRWLADYEAVLDQPLTARLEQILAELGS